MEETFKHMLSLANDHGPFPLGIVVGILMSHFAYSSATKMHLAERDANREERNEQLKLISVQQDRIDKLHLMIADKQKGGS